MRDAAFGAGWIPSFRELETKIESDYIRISHNCGNMTLHSFCALVSDSEVLARRGL